MKARLTMDYEDYLEVKKTYEVDLKKIYEPEYYSVYKKSREWNRINNEMKAILKTKEDIEYTLRHEHDKRK